MKVKKSKVDNKISVRKKMQNGGLHIDPTEPTAADSLFLLQNNRLINQLKRDFGYEIDPRPSAIPVSSWMSPDSSGLTGFEYAKTYGIENLDADIQSGREIDDYNEFRYKDKSQYVDLSKKGFFGLTDFLDEGGEDYFMPKSYIHPDIKPTSSGDFVTDAMFSDFSFDELKKVFPDLTHEDYKRRDFPKVATFLYDDLAMTPTRYLTPQQRRERIRLYGPENVGDINAPTEPMPSNYKVSKTSKPQSRPRIDIEPMQPITPANYSTETPSLNVNLNLPETDRLIDTQDIYRTPPVFNRNNVRGDERPLTQVGERRVYERPDGTRYTSVDRFSSEMIRQLKRLQRERERGTVTF
jgi:hypothetical protein